MNVLGRNESPSDVGRQALLAAPIVRGLQALGLTAITLLCLGPHTAAQDDPRDLEELRRQDVHRETRLEDRDLNRERRVEAREVEGRPVDPQAIERRNHLYQDLTRDFHAFDKDNFDVGSDARRLRMAPPNGLVESSEGVARVRQLIDRFAQEADALQLALNQNGEYIRGVRGILPDAIQFSANAQVLRDRCQREGRLATLCGDYESFDRDWQAISYKLHQIPEMARTAELRRVEVMDDLDHQLSAILKIQPQFDQRDLLRHASALVDQLGRLVEDINVEFVDPEQRRVLGGTARRAESEAQMVCDTIDAGNDSGSVVREFKEYQALWYPLARQLRQIDVNRALERTVMRISRTNREINQLLRDAAAGGYRKPELHRRRAEARYRRVFHVRPAQIGDGTARGALRAVDRGRVLRHVRTIPAGRGGRQCVALRPGRLVPQHDRSLACFRAHLSPDEQ